MELLIPSFIAGFLTVLAPCMLPVLPVIIGGSAEGKNKWKPLIIILSLGASILLFTVLLKFSTSLLFIPDYVWKSISGIIIILFGLTLLFPSAWDWLSFKLKFYKTEEALHNTQKKEGIGGTIALGAALGPVFSSCSPTYALIIAIVLPQSFGIAFLNMIIYVIGFLIPLGFIAYGGQAVVQKIKWLANPNGAFKKILGILLLVLGVGIILSWDKVLETWILDSGVLDPILNLESEFTQGFME